MPCYRFRLFEFDSDRLRLQKQGVRVKLQRKPHTMLAVLLEEPGRTVTRQELYQRLWPDSNVVEFDQGLNVVVMKLRDALGDSSDEPSYIETVAGSGYRFIEAVELVQDGTSDDGKVAAESSTQPWSTGNLNNIKSANGGNATPSTKTDAVFDTHPKGSSNTAERWQTRFRVSMSVGAFGLAAACAFGVRYMTRPLPAPRITEYVQLTHDARMKFVNGTDGINLYLSYQTASGQGTAAEVPVIGGQITPVAVDLPGVGKGPTYAVILGDASPDGTKILAYLPHNSEERDLWITGTSGRPAHHLAKAFWATWSPDGKLVVFSTAGKLFTISSDGGTAHLLADLSSLVGKGRIAFLDWSPEGGRIRFSVTPDYRNYMIWEISSDGSNLHRVLPEWDKFNKACCGRWTHDGDFYVFQLFDKVGGPAGAPNQLWAIDERRGGLRPPIKEPIQLTNNMVWWGFPLPSRDGKKIFTKATTYSGELDRLDKQTNQFRPYLGGISAGFVAFSKDGKYVAYVSYPDGILWRCNRDGTGLIQLSSPPLLPWDIAWSPDSRQIVFESRMPNGDSAASGRTAIYVVSSHGGTPALLIPEDNASESDASWSSDGKKIVYSTGDLRYLGDSSLGTVKTHILDLASHKTSTLPSGPKPYYSPRLSPDGRYVSFLAAPDPSDPVIFDLQTQRYSTLHGLPSFGGLDWNTWSHDSKSLYFRLTGGPNGESGVYLVPVNGAKPERVIDLTGFRQTGWNHRSWMGLDPTDAPLLLRDTGSTELFALTLARH